jgi:hypothetical protein
MTAEPVTTWEQIGPNGWAISPLRLTMTRGEPRQIGWHLWRQMRPGEATTRSQAVRGSWVVRERHECDYEGPWHVRRKLALADLITDAVAVTGVPVDGWKRNRQGDYVPREIAEARPLRKTP